MLDGTMAKIYWVGIRPGEIATLSPEALEALGTSVAMYSTPADVSV